MAYLGKTPSQATRARYYYTATGGETSLSGSDDNGNTLVFSDGNYVDVMLNGVTLVAGTDYNTTTANTIGGLTALTASDVVEVVVYDTFSVFGGNVNGNFNIQNGTLTAETVDVNGGAIDDTTIGGSTPAAGSFTALNTSGAVVFNEAGADVDFRVEGDTDDNLLFVNAGADTVGIGGSTGSKLGVTVSDSTAYTGAETGSSRFSIFNSDSTTNAFSSLSLQSGSSGQASATLNAIKTGASSTAFTIVTRGSGTYSEKFRIESSGNVGIGDPSPISLGAGTQGLTANGSAGGFYMTRYNGANTGYLVAESDALSVNTFTGKVLKLGTENVERMRIDSSGLSFDSGSNHLDDYEEGTWTPALNFGGGTIGISYNQQFGRYTKVGNLVHAQFVIVLTSKGSSSGTAQITGLPFDPVLNNTAFYIYSDRVSFSGGVLTGYISSGTNITFYNQVSGSNAQVANTAFVDNSYFTGQFTFTVS